MGKRTKLEVVLLWNGMRGHARPVRLVGGALVPGYACAQRVSRCAHVVIFYRILDQKLEYREGITAKRCPP